jgi:hypothetical protein
MSEDEPDSILGAEPSRLSRTRGRWIALSVRCAVWGLVVGLLPTFAHYGVGPLWLMRADLLTVAGLLVSGTGMLVAAVLVLRTLPRGFSALKVASLAAIPLALGLLSIPFTALAPLSAFADLVDAMGPLGLLMGVVVVVALLVGFLGRRRA